MRSGILTTGAAIGEGAVMTVRVGRDAAVPGDVVAAYAEDEPLGRGRLEPVGSELECRITLAGARLLAFPAFIRLQNERDGSEIEPGLALATASDFVRAAVAPIEDPVLRGLSSEQIAFSARVPILPRYPRPATLRIDGSTVSSGWSVPDALDPVRHEVVFAHPALVRPGATLSITDDTTGAEIFRATVTVADLFDAALAHGATLAREVRRLAAEQAAMARQLDRVDTGGREKRLLDRLDLFYLLLSDRIDRALGRADPPPPVVPTPSPVLHVTPGEVEGVGLYGLETDGATEWRWLGPDVTLVFRAPGPPIERVVLMFHAFGAPEGEEAVQAWCDAMPLAAELRPALGGRHALDIRLPPSSGGGDGMLILHLSFARHRSTAADPRRLSAVFSGADLFRAVAG